MDENENVPKVSGLSIFSLIRINALVWGLELSASAAFTCVPPLLLKCGFSETNMSFILGVGKYPQHLLQ